MPVPGFQEFTLPLLQILADGTPYTIAEAREILSQALNLSESDKNELLPSGKQSRYVNRFSWASIYLRKTGLIEYTDNRKLTITSRGNRRFSKTRNEWT